MPFPERERVVYKKNVLDSVICQLRFPRVLRIAEKPPSEFQERIREEYPTYNERQEGPEIPEPIRGLVHIPNDVLHDFGSADGNWTLTLSAEFLSLTTTAYTQYEEFDQRLRVAVQALIDAFRPAFWSRIGLRYRDVFGRSSLGFSPDEGWGTLIQPHVVGELGAAAEISASIAQMQAVSLIKLSIETPSFVRFFHGFADGPEKAKSKEQAYVLDSDFYTNQRTKIVDAHKLLGEFKIRSGRLFRWAITEKLHLALGPQPVPEFIPRE